MPGARMLKTMVMTLIEPRIEEAPPPFCQFERLPFIK